MSTQPPLLDQLDPRARRFYREALQALGQARIPFLVGGAYAFAHYTGIIRHTKDFDVFVRPADAARALAVLGQTGYHTELTFPHWLGKVFSGDYFVDLIFSSGNGQCSVDEDWFAHAVAGQALGMACPLVPVEEMIWQKSYIMERERFDGADVLHLLRARGPDLDWDRLLARFGPSWRILLAHLVLFGFVYPGEKGKIPDTVVRTLERRLAAELDQQPFPETLCRGTLLSREQYLADTERWGYHDARLPPHGRMSPADVVHWTAAIDR